MFKRITITLFLVLSIGCVSTENIPLDTAVVSKNPPQNLTTSQREKPSFSAMTAGKAAFALIGAAAMIAEGNKIVSENNIEDPAAHIAKKLEESLSSKYQAEPISTDAVANSSDAEKIAALYPGVDWIVDVQTINWSFVYFPTDWSHYRVIYSAKLRLIDGRSKAVIAEGFCNRTPEKTGGEPTHEELLANNAARIKSELALAADYCIQEFKSNVLAL